MNLNLNKGFHLIQNFLSDKEIYEINANIPAENKGEKKGGVRRIEKKSSVIREFISSEKMQTTANKVLKSEASFVRAILFNKTEENNWLVAWHQDKTVTVSQQFVCAGWGPWSIKDSIHHVQPPVNVLESMITFRLHLDDVDKDNGCLKVIPFSHEYGVLNHSEIQEIVDESNYVNCEGKAGSILMMRPHILHASSKVPKPSQRRVLHIEYSSYQLPEGVSWA